MGPFVPPPSGLVKWCSCGGSYPRFLLSIPLTHWIYLLPLDKLVKLRYGLAVSLEDKAEFRRKLKSLGYDSYNSYLKSDYWASVRRRYFEKYPAKRCHKCASAVDIQLHHKTYDRLGEELLTDFNVLCRACHQQLHAQEHPLGSVYTTTRVFLADRAIGPTAPRGIPYRRPTERDIVREIFLETPRVPRGLTVKKATRVLALLSEKRR